MSGGRQRGPDQLRGLLLTLVIFGHTYAAGVSDDRSKWILYGFHMPLFFAVSGWLLTRRSLTRRSLPELLGYYWRRMIWQWLLVSVVFGLWKGALPTSFKGTIDVLFFEPLFHLWFIPALILMVVVTQVVLRAGCGWWTLAGVAATSFALFELPLGKPYIPDSLSSLDHRYGAYFIWFMLGFAVRNATWPRPPQAISVPVGLAVAGTGLYVYNEAFTRSAWQHDIGFAGFNVGLIILLPAILELLNRPIPLIGDAMVRVGKGSLWIYLLHPFATELWRPHDDGSWRGRLIGIVITIGIVAVATVMSHLMANYRGPSGVPAAPPGGARAAEAAESSIDPPLGPAGSPALGAGHTAVPPTGSVFAVTPKPALDLTPLEPRPVPLGAAPQLRRRHRAAPDSPTRPIDVPDRANRPR